MKISKKLKVMIKAAKKAGNFIMKNYGKVDFEMKKDKSFVSIVDKTCEEIIKTTLQNTYPTYSFLGEETGFTQYSQNESSKYTWVVDPLDGTTNYKMKNPFFNVSIALAIEDTPVFAVVYNPLTKELFHAEKGKGTYLNNKRIYVSKTPAENALLTFCHGKSKHAVNNMLKIYTHYKKKNRTIRQIGAAALELAYVAAGRADSYFMTSVNAWDVAAGQLLVSEAGGKVTDFEGKPFTIKSKTLLSTNNIAYEELKKELLKIIKKK